MSEEKVFSEWSDCEVDCNQCAEYWKDACDGVPNAQKRVCTAFKAQRGIVIPEEVNALKTRLKRLTERVRYLLLSNVFVWAYLLITEIF